jgi:hypothetical protein
MSEVNITTNEKRCSMCNSVKKLSEYSIIKNTTRYRSYCKICGNEMCRKYKANNRKKISDYNKVYKAEYKEDINVYNHMYNIEHREEIQTRQTKQHRERKLIDPQYKISCSMRSMLNKVVKSQVSSIDTMSKFGCSRDFLVEWFEFLFEFNEGMTMDNYGDYWHIDHVIPCSKFDVTNNEELKKCFHWTNLQPLVALENSKKVAKINLEEIQFQEERVTIFLDTIYTGDNTQYNLLEEYDKTEYLN